MTDFDVAIIGAGIVGLACASRLATTGRSVVVLERHAGFGEETSSRNSGVVHAGLYYDPGSLKAWSCIEGRKLLYARCAWLGIGHRRTGKLIVATTEAELTVLETLRQRALDCGAGDLEPLSRAALQRLEPNVSAVGALLSRESGIVDVHELMYSHKQQASGAGATFAFLATVTALSRETHHWSLLVQSPRSEPSRITARQIVNAAGLAADDVTELAGVDTNAHGLRQKWCKGDYFSVASRHRGLVSRLVYPVPAAAGLGIHVTLNLAGELTAGPDAEYVDAVSYQPAAAKRAAFAAAVQRYLPGISETDLTPGYAGIRPKLQGPGEPFRDFVVQDCGELGAPGFLALLGIESPGLTASEALGHRVSEMLKSMDGA